MRVAIPTKNNRIDPQYSRAAEFTIYEIEIELVKKKEIVPLGKTAIADFLTEQDINAVICGNIRSSARNILRAKRIELTYGVLGEVDDVMIRYLSGERLGIWMKTPTGKQAEKESNLWHYWNVFFRIFM